MPPASERTLAESERYFRALIEQSSDTITLLDAETRVLYASPSIEPTLGYRPDELLGRRAFELVHPDDLESVRAVVMDGIATPGAVRRLEYRFRHRDGSWRFLDGVGRNLLDDPAVRGIVVNARDVTERKRVEEMLRDRERQLAAAQAIAHVGSWEWDIDTNTVTWSDEMRRIFGLPLDAPASFAGFLERLHPDDRSRIQAIVAASVAERRPAEYDWRTIRPDGEERLIHTRNMLVLDETGRPVRMLGTALDITERRQAEQNQRTLLRELQTAVAEVKTLEGILPICASCKRIRGDNDRWQPVELYVREHTNAEFSHGLCPDCAQRDWGDAAGPGR